jgi:hypothetical protein
MSKKPLEKLKFDFKTKLLKIQENCKHKWVEDGTDVEGWWEVKCYKCIFCDKTKTER